MHPSNPLIILYTATISEKLKMAGLSEAESYMNSQIQFKLLANIYLFALALLMGSYQVAFI